MVLVQPAVVSTMKVNVFHHKIVTVISFLLGIANSWTILPGNRLFRAANLVANPIANSVKLHASADNTPMMTGIRSQQDGSKLDQMVLEYIDSVERSIHSGQFMAFTIHGPAKNDFDSQIEARGFVRMIKGRLIALTNKVVIQATFKYHGATDICKNWSIQDCRTNLESILLIPVVLVPESAQHVIPISEWGISPPTTFGLPRGIKSATLEMTNGTKWELKLNRGVTTLKLSRGSRDAESIEQQKQTHDRNTFTFVDLSNPVWLALGVTSTSTGTVKPGMSSKLRQCQKFVEIVDCLVRECIDNNTENQTSNISIVDMGCGRGYLTFALHSYLHKHYRTQVSSRGIDMRPKLVNEISDIASASGDEFDRLQFEVGTIESFLAEPRQSKDLDDKITIEVVIALHACDTASDDALWSGICRNSAVLVVAPCCHRQLRPQLNQHVSGGQKSEHPYSDILRHNIYRERMAETITDSMRALLLELSGYTVQVFEFIGGEHTSKNVMITAVKNMKMHPLRDSKVEELNRNRLERLQSLADLHGIKQHKLASWIGIALSERNDHLSANDIVQSRPRPTKMPPLTL